MRNSPRPSDPADRRARQRRGPGADVAHDPGRKQGIPLQGNRLALVTTRRCNRSTCTTNLKSGIVAQSHIPTGFVAQKLPSYHRQAPEHHRCCCRKARRQSWRRAMRYETRPRRWKNARTRKTRELVLALKSLTMTTESNWRGRLRKNIPRAARGGERRGARQLLRIF